MSQNIKSTLYRFVTMRSPELISDQEKETGFISYPGSIEEAPIVSAAKNSDDTAEVFQKQSEAISRYIPTYPTIESLKKAFPGFNDFAKWLIVNRTRLTVEETDLKIEGLQGVKPSNAQMISIWNDLHYSILTNGSSYLRDILLSFIVAEYFVAKVDNQNPVARVIAYEKTDEAYRKLAQSRVVIDKSLFMGEPAQVSQQLSREVSAKGFQQEMDVALATEENKELEAILKEVEKAANLRIKNTQKAQDAYQKEYDTNVEKAYNRATVTERVIEDPATGKTVVVQEFENLKLPTYDFETVPELEDPVALRVLSEDTKLYLESLKEESGVDTFEEAKSIINTKIKENTTIISDNIQIGTKQVSVMGAVLPVRTANAGSAFTYSLCTPEGTDTPRFVVTLTIGVPDTSYEVISMKYQLNYTDGTHNSNTLFRQEYINDSLVIKFSSGVEVGKKEKSMECEITFSNGTIYTVDVPDFKRGNCYTGVLGMSGSGGNTGNEFATGFGIQRLGIADYRKVEQEVCCYVPGEVSHIENIMAREYKEKSTRRLRRQEDTTTTSTEQETETLTETTSTSRFEMNQEVADLIAKDQSFAAAAGVSYSAGPFSASANASFASNTSKEESNVQAISQAKELTERALDRVVQKVREERITKVVEEYEENSSHGFDNRKGDKHISGVYRWVDKIYNNKILNYGKRLMYEFMIPEPAAFHDLAVQLKANGGDDVLIKPQDPRTATILNLSDYKKITASTLAHWSGIYNADIDSMPEEQITISKVYSKDDNSINSGRFGHAGHDSIDIPESYYVKSYSGYFTAKQGIHDGTEVRHGNVTIGGKRHTFNREDKITVSGSFSNEKIVNTLGFAVTSWDVGVYAFNLLAKCELTTATKEAWQIKAFEAIIDAYETKLAEYEEKLAEQKALQEETLKVNPGFYRQIEKTVLRKNCITYLLGQDKVGIDMLIGRNDIKNIRPDHTNDALNTYAARVKFFEQAFEWDIMSYNFYPFYWANKENWASKYIIENNDPLFKSFLQSGMARVIVTVRPGFEEMVNWYLATGQIWNGGQVPTIDDEEFVSIVQELQNPTGEVEETWETRVPTSLTVIQAGSIGLNVEGLPCDDECADWAQFDSDRNPIQQTNDLIGGTDPDPEGVDFDVVGVTAIR